MYSSGDAPQLARRSAGSASGDAPQLARRSAGSASGDTSQLDASSDGTVSMFRIGSFNVGVEQSMLTSKRTAQYMRKVEGVITTCVQDAGLHIMNLCEVGAHLQGLSAAGIEALDFNIFQGPKAPSVSVNNNYLTAWGFDPQEEPPNKKSRRIGMSDGAAVIVLRSSKQRSFSGCCES